jgi:drug/metabolite transporter (DMT)-like permease
MSQTTDRTAEEVRIVRHALATDRRAVGMALAAVTAVISGFAVFINGYGVIAWRDAGVGSAAYTTAKNLVAAALLLGVALAVRRRRAEPVRIQGSHRLRLLLIGVIGGAVPFLLFFEGLSRASSVHAAFLHKTLVIWVALLAVPFLRERVTGLHLAAMGLLVGGEAVLSRVDGFAFGAGEAMILAATLLWACEIIIAKRVLADVPSTTVGVARMGIGSIVLVAWVVATGGLAGLASLGAQGWMWAIATGFILTGYVATWYLALSKAQAVDVTAVLVVGALITALLRTGVQGVVMPPVAGVALLLAGGAAAVAAGLRGRRVPA